MAVSIFTAIPVAQALALPPPEPDLLWENTDSNGDVTDVATGKLTGNTDVAFLDNTIPDTVFTVYGINGTVYRKNISVAGYSIAVGDVDGDGKNEVIAGGYNDDIGPENALGVQILGKPGITVFEEDGTFKFYETNSQVVKDIEIGDIDGDGINDIVACNGGTGGKVYVINGTDGNDITGWPQDFGSESIQDIALGNLDGAGGKDVAIISDSSLPPPPTLYVYNSTGIELWRNSSVRGRSIKIGDVDNDHEEEVVIGDYESKHVYVYKGSSDTLEYSFDTDSPPSEVELGDLDGDGTLEIAAITEDEATLYAIDINATGQANKMWSYNIGWNPTYYGEGLAIGDVDRDYKNEVIAASNNGTVYAFDGIDSTGDELGDIVWVSAELGIKTPRKIGINDIEIADLDDDGDMDVIVGTSGGRSVYALSTQEHTVQVNGNNVYFDSDPSNITDVASPPMPPDPPAGYNFPYGVFSINITGLDNNQTVIITITLPANLPAGSEYWKYSANGNGSTTGQPGWYQIPLGDNDGDNVITITLQDGGIGDADGIANGVIIDQGGPALPPAKVPALTPIGMMALVGLFSIIAVVSIRKKKT